MDTIVFQRLGRLLQNPTTSFVYPNATHTRKAHSLGVMHLTGIVLRKLLVRQSALKVNDIMLNPILTEPVVMKMDKRGKIEKEDLDDLSQTGCNWWDEYVKEDPAFIIEVVRIAALMHDIGHGPFSHIFEEVVKQKINNNFRHEKMSAKLLRSIENYISPEAPKMENYEREIINYAADILEGRVSKELSFVYQLIDSPLDMDKLDYVNRDAYHAGPLEYGIIDYERVVDGLRVKKNELKYSVSSIGAIARTFKALEYMYLYVYFHKTCRAVDLQIFEMMLSNESLLREIIENENNYINWDDGRLLWYIQENGNGESKNLAKDLLSRRLIYKSVAEKKMAIGPLFRFARPGFEQGKEEVENKFKDIGAKIDYFSVSPIRIDPKKLIDWLESEIFVKKDGTPTNLQEVDEVLLGEIRNFGVMVRLYVKRKIAGSEELSDKTRINEAVQNFYDLFR
jgi:HD superfamily phosphohydrolase